MNANEKQIGGRHYKDRKIQHWDYAAQLPYLEGLATKYIDRHARKGGKEDLLKAIHTIEKMIEEYYPTPSPADELNALLMQKSQQLGDPDLSPSGIVEMMLDSIPDSSACPHQSECNHAWSHVYRHGRDGRMVEVKICDYCKAETDK